MNEKLEMLREAVEMANMQEEVEVNEELAYSIFGENLEIDHTVAELAEMFILDL